MSTTLEPHLVQPTHPKELQHQKRIALPLPFEFSHSPFVPLTAEELKEEWGKELHIALAFAEEFDLYRAITSFKRALILLPLDKLTRRLEIEYDIALAYYLGKKYHDTLLTFEKSGLVCVDASFPAYGDLLLILYDSYKQLGEIERAEQLLCRIEQFSSPAAGKLSLLSILEKGDLVCLESEAGQTPYFHAICENYQRQAKSVRRAEMLNAVLPGAGYWYVEQKGTAVTAFLINALFIAAAVEFFDHGYTAAGIITLSLESGWYFGGIYGGGLAAKAYNERLYEGYAGKIAQREGCFPLLMLKYSF